MNSNTQQNIVTLKTTGITAISATTLFDKQVYKWIEIDNKIKKINAELKTLREVKNDV